MRRKLFWIAPWVLLALVLGYVAIRRCPTATPWAVLPATRPAGPPPGAMANWRWIGVLTHGGSCPVAQGSRWSSQPLFPLSHSPALAAFCLYKHAGFSSAGIHPTFAPGAPPIQLARDFASVTLQRDPQIGDELKQSVGPSLADHFLAQAGRTALPTNSDLQAVRLAFLDTQPTGSEAPSISGSSGHGYSLARFAESLVCKKDPASKGPQPCVVDITTQLALPILSFDSTDLANTHLSTTNGGFFGSVTDLALAIVAEVDAWRLRADQAHLVINLSLGWDGDLFGGGEATVDAMPPPVQAVYQALEYASEQEVLVIAAAGNRVAGPEQGRGPLYPAAWEKVTTPAGDPLVYAAGGVQTSGQPLSNARPGAIPSRGAYADHAVVTAIARPAADMLTGSSVGAAVVSTAAAAVWYYRHHLSRRELMAMLDASGDRLGRSADFWNVQVSTSAPPVRRIAVCQAVSYACSQPGAQCIVAPETLGCGAWSQGIPALGGLLQPVSVGPQIDVSSWIRPPAGSLSPCPGRDIRYALQQSLGVDPCPSEQFFEPRGAPWTCPQPSDPPCPSCVMVPMEPPPTNYKYTLKVRIRPDWARTKPLLLSTLDIDHKDGSPPMRYEINQPISKNSSGFELASIGDGSSLAGAAITLTFVVPAEGGIPEQAILNEVFVGS